MTKKITKKITKTSKKEKQRYQTNKRKLVLGMLTVPLNPDGKYHDHCGSSYIVSAHIDWLKNQGVVVIPIPYYKQNLDVYLKKVNGVYLPSGGAFAGTQKEYYYASKYLLNYAIDQNDKGNYFPVWGGCMGMQQMLIAIDGHDDVNNFLELFDSSENLYLPLHFTDDAKECRLFSKYTNHEKKMFEKRRCSLHNHKMGLSPEKFNASAKLSRFFNVIHISYDRNEKPFVSTIEAKHYPIYGVQWHPERKKTFYKLSVFFKEELEKSSRTTFNVSKKKIKTRKIRCMKYSNNLYKYCNFYWEEENDENNPSKCDFVANSRKNIRGRIYDVIG